MLTSVNNVADANSNSSSNLTPATTFNIADVLPQIVWTANPDGTPDFCNQRWYEYTGLSVEETRLRGWSSALHPDDSANWQEVWNKSIQSGLPYEIEYRFKREADNTYRWHLARALPIKDNSGKIIKWCGTCTEIKERELISMQLSRDAARLNEIIATQQVLMRANLDIESFFKLAISQMDILTASAGSAIELIEELEMVYRAVSGVAANHLGLRLQAASSLSGLCVACGQVLYCRDVESDVRVDKVACRAMGVQSMIVAPLMHGGKAIGVFKSMATTTDAFTSSDLQTLQLIAGLIGEAIGQKIALDQNQRTLEKFHQAIEKLKASELRTRLIIESSHDAFVSINIDGMIIGWNKQAEEMFGWSQDEVKDQLIESFFVTKRVREILRSGLARFKENSEESSIRRHIELAVRKKNHKEIPVELTINVVTIGTHTEFCAFIRDISERKKNEAQLIKLAQFDQLTGLCNRGLFFDRLKHAMEKVKRTRNIMSLLYLDIDHFKHINDTLGHFTGDQILREFSARLKSTVRGMDTVARLGGDEFIVLMENLSCVGDAKLIAEKILNIIRKPIITGDQTICITTSIGGLIFCGEESDENRLVELTDQHLYVAKQNGRNRYFFDETDS